MHADTQLMVQLSLRSVSCYDGPYEDRICNKILHLSTVYC